MLRTTEPDLTASGRSVEANWSRINVEEALAKVLNPPPGSMEGLMVKSEEVAVSRGSTDQDVEVAAPAPPVIAAPPDVYMAAVPADDPLTLNDETLMVPLAKGGDAKPDVDNVVPLTAGSGWAVVIKMEPPGCNRPEAFSAPAASAKREER